MNAPEPTNDAVSDERLRELLAFIDKAHGMARDIVRAGAHGKVGVLYTHANSLTHMANHLRASLTSPLNRRSVTSQASEGEVVGWQWRNKGDGNRWRPMHEDATEADFQRSICEYRPVYAAPVSKRVERLEAALKHIADGKMADYRDYARQALQGGRS